MLKDHYKCFWILKSVAHISSEAHCINCKRTILEKWLQTGFVFESVLSFADREITGKLSKYWLPLNHHWKKFKTFKASAAKVTWACCLQALVFLEIELPLHISIKGHTFFFYNISLWCFNCLFYNEIVTQGIGVVISKQILNAHLSEARRDERHR